MKLCSVEALEEDELKYAVRPRRSDVTVDELTGRDGRTGRKQAARRLARYDSG